MQPLQYQYRPGTFTGWISRLLEKHAKRRRSASGIRGGAALWFCAGRACLRRMRVGGWVGGGGREEGWGGGWGRGGLVCVCVCMVKDGTWTCG